MARKQGNPGIQRYRKKRFERCLALIERCFKRQGKVSIVDLGGTRAYWDILPLEVLKEQNISITIVNNEVDSGPHDNAHFSYITADACNMSGFGDNSFDIVHSNSVIEHVGNWEQMEDFAREVRRLAPEYFVQTPNYWFPVEPHYMLPCYHWLPVALQIRILGWKYPSHSFRESVLAQERIKLLSRRAFAVLFPDGKIYRERVLMFTKSFIAIRSVE